MLLLGIGAASGVIALLCKRKGESPADPLLTGAIAMAGAFIGGILLRPLMKLPEIVFDWEKFGRVPADILLNYMFGEFVFYGALIGGTLAALWFCRKFKMPFLPIADYFSVAIPVGQAFGRIGCFLGGCCYGMKVSHSHPLGVIYPPRTDGVTGLAPTGVPVLPAPLIESACTLVIAALIFLLGRIFKLKPGQSIALYGMLYGIQRFILEFYRGDLVRGLYLGLSTSQYISILLFMGGLLLFLFGHRRARGKQEA